MVVIENQKFCNCCLNPVGLNALNPETGQVLAFYQHQGRIFCEVCYELFVKGNFPSRQYFDREFEDFLIGKKRLLYAYSGGLDSTATLALLAQKAREKNCVWMSLLWKLE